MPASCDLEWFFISDGLYGLAIFDVWPRREKWGATYIGSHPGIVRACIIRLSDHTGQKVDTHSTLLT